MKPGANTIEYTNASLEVSYETAPVIWHIGSRPLERSAARHSLSRAMRVVGLMAFAQSLVFLVIWLLVCTSAGAAPAKKTAFTPDLQLSTFAPAKSRDPFGRIGVSSPEVKSVPGAPIALQLDGILYESSNPAAIVNGRLLTLDKTVTLTTANGEVPVRAIEITRDRATVEVGGQKIELRLSLQNAAGQQ